MLTARTEELDTVHGLDAGADDYRGRPLLRQPRPARFEIELPAAGA